MTTPDDGAVVTPSNEGRIGGGGTHSPTHRGPVDVATVPKNNAANSPRQTLASHPCTFGAAGVDGECSRFDLVKADLSNALDLSCSHSVLPFFLVLFEIISRFSFRIYSPVGPVARETWCLNDP